MKINELNEKLKSLKIDEETIKAFLELMDLKIENDMKEVILEIKGLKNELNTKFDSNRNEFNSKVDSNRNEFNSKVDSMKWTITIGIAIATAIIAGINIALKFITN